jgi:hypothetical protein
MNQQDVEDRDADNLFRYEPINKRRNRRWMVCSCVPYFGTILFFTYNPATTLVFARINQLVSTLRLLHEKYEVNHFTKGVISLC